MSRRTGRQVMWEAIMEVWEAICIYTSAGGRKVRRVASGYVIMKRLTGQKFTGRNYSNFYTASVTHFAVC